MNTAVFLTWKYAEARRDSYGDWKLYMTMRENFLVSYQRLKDGKWWTMVTCAFSQSQPLHFLINMYVLYQFGPAVMGIIGAPQFVGLYLAAGTVGAACSALYNQFYLPYTRGPREGHGASGAILGSITLFAATHPHSTLSLYGLIPIRASFCVAGLVAYDAWQAYTGRTGVTDCAAHLGGAATGLLWWILRVRRGRVGRW
ncbi:hypothetical protein HDU85_007315 [Gaertneriomyces sp. JEL0708]|nr:hypothetical protein HDU85_007315 [Gaertneriomyces sp. JEL0708]